MRQMGRLEDVDGALVTAALSLADAVDADPGNASLWARYMDALDRVGGLGHGGSDDLSDLLAQMQSAVGDPEV